MKKILNLIIITFYIISLCTKSFIGNSEVFGIFLLIFGGFSILIGNLFAFGAWTANILFFITLIRKIKLSTRLILSGIAVLLGILSVFVTDLPMHMGSSTSPVKIGIGFYFWIGSFVLLFVKNLFEYKFKTNKKEAAIIFIVFSILTSCNNKTKAKFTITNCTENAIDSINIRTFNHEVSFNYVKLEPKQSAIYWLDMADLPKVDGSYMLTYKDSIIRYKQFGYFTNGYPLEKLTKISIKNDTIVITQIFQK